MSTDARTPGNVNRSADRLQTHEPALRESTLADLIGEAAADRQLAAADRQRAAEHLLEAYRDELTGALNRRPGREQLLAEIDRARRTRSPLAVLFVDIDGLKSVDDTAGHEAGDRLLAAAGTALRTSLRAYDVIVRYGGDEFVCALPAGTADVAEESSARVHRTLGELVPGATLSVGHALLQPADPLDALLRRADRDLYERRARTGRDVPAKRVAGTLDLVERREASPRTSARPTVACGACGARIPLSEFTLNSAVRMTRAADCPGCGEVTLIQLAARHGDAAEVCR